ncbi:MAG: hypothetical protein WC254_01225 [Candidatus Woesearchaeota archaeon]|jgi:hypothetical protein
MAKGIYVTNNMRLDEILGIEDFNLLEIGDANFDGVEVPISPLEALFVATAAQHNGLKSIEGLCCGKTKEEILPLVERGFLQYIKNRLYATPLACTAFYRFGFTQETYDKCFNVNKYAVLGADLTARFSGKFSLHSLILLGVGSFLSWATDDGMGTVLAYRLGTVLSENGGIEDRHVQKLYCYAPYCIRVGFELAAKEHGLKL